MGREILEKDYSANDYVNFNHKIHDQLDTLKQVIDLQILVLVKHLLAPN